jgi:hypothetical protein
MNTTFAAAAGFTIKPFSGPNYHRNALRDLRQAGR